MDLNSIDTPLYGEIWLANLNPSKKSNEIGKTHPVLIFQNDELNNSDYPTTIIFPLTTSLIDDAQPLRYRINAHEELEKDSDILIAHIRSIDNDRFIKKITKLSNKDMQYIKTLFDEIVS